MIDVDIRYLPGQDPDEIRAQVVGAARRRRVVAQFHRAPAIVDRNNPFVQVLSECVSKVLDTETMSVGRDGASDAICFIDAGVPGGRVRPHRRRPPRPRRVGVALVAGELPQALVDFVRLIPKRLSGEPHLRIA